MSSSDNESETGWSQWWSETSGGESDADRIRRNDNSLTEVEIHNCWLNSDDAIEILDALKNNTVVKKVLLVDTEILLPGNQEVHLKLCEVMQCNKSVECLHFEMQIEDENYEIEDETNEITHDRHYERLYAAMATSGGWSSLKELAFYNDGISYDEPLSLTDAEHISSFIIQCENLRTFSLEVPGSETGPIIETLSRTKVQSLRLSYHSTFPIQNEGSSLAAALEGCTCITDLYLKFPSYVDHVEFFQILLLESIPKMLGLKKLELRSCRRVDQGFFDMIGQCIGGHQGEIQELILGCHHSSENSSSIVGLAPALRRLKVIRFDCWADLTLQGMSELSGIIADCDELEEFGYDISTRGNSTDDVKAICQLWSRFPSLKRVTKIYPGASVVDLREEGRFTAFLEMIKTSKTIEQVPPFECNNAEEEATIQHHCRNNMIHNQIRENGLLAATVPSSSWPLILKKFSDMPDVLYYLLQQKHGAMIGPTSCKRKQAFD